MGTVAEIGLDHHFRHIHNWCEIFLIYKLLYATVFGKTNRLARKSIIVYAQRRTCMKILKKTKCDLLEDEVSGWLQI